MEAFSSLPLGKADKKRAPNLPHDAETILERSAYAKRVHEKTLKNPSLGKALATAFALHAGAGVAFVEGDAIRTAVERVIERVQNEVRKDMREIDAGTRRLGLASRALIDIERHRFQSGHFILQAEAIDEHTAGREQNDRLAETRYTELLQHVQRHLSDIPHDIDHVRSAILQSTEELGYNYAGIGGTLMSDLLRTKRGSCQQIALLVSALAYDSGLHDVFLRSYNPTEHTYGHVAPIMMRNTSRGMVAFDFVSNAVAPESERDLPIERLPWSFITPHVRYPMVFFGMRGQPSVTPHDINPFYFPQGKSEPFHGSAPIFSHGIMSANEQPSLSTEPVHRAETGPSGTDLAMAFTMNTEGALRFLYPQTRAETPHPLHTQTLSEDKYILFETKPLSAEMIPPAPTTLPEQGEAETPLSQEDMRLLEENGRRIETLKSYMHRSTASDGERYVTAGTLLLAYDVAIKVVHDHHMRSETSVLTSGRDELVSFLRAHQESLRTFLNGDLLPTVLLENTPSGSTNNLMARAMIRSALLLSDIDQELRFGVSVALRLIHERASNGACLNATTLDFLRYALVTPHVRSDALRTLNALKLDQLFRLVSRTEGPDSTGYSERSDTMQRLASDVHNIHTSMAMRLGLWTRESDYDLPKLPHEEQAEFRRSIQSLPLFERITHKTSPEETRSLLEELVTYHVNSDEPNTRPSSSAL